MDDPTAWLKVARAPGLHAGLLGRLPATAGLETLLGATSRSDLASFGLGETTIAALLNPGPEGISRDEAWLCQPGRRLVTWGSPDYPPLLASIPDAPLVLFVEGNAQALQLPQLALVGSRSPSSIGRDTATQLAAHLARAGLTITSGLALGIDAASHRGALQAGGTTVAVLGCGPDTVYPREHASLAREIAASGAVISDLPTGVPPLKQHFPRRNRIISGLSVGTVVVEAALHSGSLITARLAGEQGREVFAVPGSIHNPLSRGCHALIRQGARLVETADDIIAELGALLGSLEPASGVEAPEAQGVFGSALDKEYEILLDALGFEPATVDTLVVRTGYTADVVASMLLVLELEGRIAQQHGGSYCRRLPGN